MNNSLKSCAIFCRVIDNFGDAGVCWRLARQLARDHGWRITLYIDRPDRLMPLLGTSGYGSIGVYPWSESLQRAAIPDVVIEAFACELPTPYVEAMVRRDRAPVWINLEYLSAEAWIEGCHELASPHPQSSLVKHFFFPGFTPRSGGLLRERDYSARHAVFDPNAFAAEWSIQRRDNELVLSYFAYAGAPFDDLVAALAASTIPVRMLIPGAQTNATTIGNLAIQPVPFLPQPQFDQLLWYCDLNFVRGEDSFVRAQWAGRPFIWSIYQQGDDAHMVKLCAFLDHQFEVLSDQSGTRTDPMVAQAIREAWLDWNAGRMFDWLNFRSNLPQIQQLTRRWRDSLLSQSDLAARLVRFCDALNDRIE